MSTNLRTASLGVLIVAILYPTLFTLCYFVGLQSQPVWLQQLVYVLGKVAQFVLLPVLAWQAIPRSEFGLPRCSTKLLAQGLLLGLLLGGAILFVALYWLLPSGYFAEAGRIMVDKLRGFDLADPNRYTLLGLFYTVAHSGAEEFYWRWFVDRRLRSVFGPRCSMLLSSVGFAAHHVVIIATYLGWTNPMTYVASAAVGIGGAIWAWCDRRDATITRAWISHALVDTALFTAGYKILLVAGAF